MQTFSVPTSIRQHMECVFRSAGVNNLSNPGFHHLQCSEDLSPEQNRSFFGSSMPIPTESRTYEGFPT